MDTRTPDQRSRIMRSVRAYNTGPELVVRRIVHALGFRFRLHGKFLPGKPDLVLARHRAVVFVNGCFWHGHGCSKGRLPKSKLDFWAAKIARNRARDASCVRALEADGWRVLTVWQCETRDLETLRKRIDRFFSESLTKVGVTQTKERVSQTAAVASH
jgi:DNA mismatch endonuclease (patch repair protein)